MPVLDFKNGKIERTFVEKVKHAVKSGIEWTGERIRNTVEYVKDRPQDAMKIAGLAVAVTGGLEKAIRTVNRSRAIRLEKFHRDRQIYDHSSNQFLTTKRKLRKEDIDRMNKLRREKGLRVSEALSELNLLQK